MHFNVREEIGSLKGEFRNLQGKLMEFTEQNSKKMVDALGEKMMAIAA